MSAVSSPLSLADIKPKMELHGNVKRVELAGAFVDVGLDHEAFLHISQVKGKRIKNVRDVVKQGQEITAWVQNVDLATGRVDLTMFKPAAVDWQDLAEGQVYTGKVVRLEKFGAFVDFGAERPGLVHVSEMGDGYVSTPEDVVSSGQEVQVKIIRVNRERNQIDLSMKGLADSESEPSEAEEMPTAMALAMQRALKGEEVSANAKNAPAGGMKRHGRPEMEDVLRRTLDLQQKE